MTVCSSTSLAFKGNRNSVLLKHIYKALKSSIFMISLFLTVSVRNADALVLPLFNVYNIISAGLKSLTKALHTLWLLRLDTAAEQIVWTKVLKNTNTATLITTYIQLCQKYIYIDIFCRWSHWFTSPPWRDAPKMALNEFNLNKRLFLLTILWKAYHLKLRWRTDMNCTVMIAVKIHFDCVFFSMYGNICVIPWSIHMKQKLAQRSMSSLSAHLKQYFLFP